MPSPLILLEQADMAMDYAKMLSIINDVDSDLKSRTFFGLQVKTWQDHVKMTEGLFSWNFISKPPPSDSTQFECQRKLQDLYKVKRSS